MHVTFYGGVREVTGSMHLITTETDHILLDCGLFQGRRKETEQKNNVLPFDPGIITNLLLSHAHIDHSGRIPFLTKNKFNGRIVCTRATADACEYLLLDSAHIQMSDADYLNYKTARSHLNRMGSEHFGKKSAKRDVDKMKKSLKKNRHQLNIDCILDLIKENHLERVNPLYTVDDAQKALNYFAGYPYRYPITIGNGISCRLYEAGHILGSAISIMKIRENGHAYTICYTGDIGRFGKPILKDPSIDFEQDDREINLLIMESTYGNRYHESVVDLKPRLKNILIEATDRGGSILIPSFAFGRTQELLYLLHELYNEDQVPRIPIYVDSPLATKITRVFGEHPELYDRETHEHFLEHGQNPFMAEQMHFISSVAESMDLMREEKPHVVISASGMCEGGRILHHLRYKIHQSRNTILLVGYMAQNTLGRRILEQGTAYEKRGRSGPAPILKFLNKAYPLKAHVVKVGGFSAHADKTEMLRFLKQSNLRIKQIALVHGEEDQTFAFARWLGKEGFSVKVPAAGETINII